MVTFLSISDTLGTGGQPSTKPKKSGGRGTVALLKETVQMGCVFQGSPQKKSILREIEKLGSNHTVKFSKGTMRHAKIRERKGPSQGVTQKCVPQERILWAPKFQERTQDETPKTGVMRPQRRMGPGMGCPQTRKGGKRYVLFSCRSLGGTGTLFKKIQKSENM